MELKYYKKPNGFFYFLGKLLAFLPYKILFRPKIIRNELKKEKKGCVLICNHECSLDFLYPFYATHRKCTFVLSKSFKESLFLSRFFDKLGVISKQQFQTSLLDMNKMKAVVDGGNPLVIFPAGLMCENGVSTPIPESTYRFLQFLNTNVYVGRIRGSYFVNSKWTKSLKRGRTYFETYKLFDKKDIVTTPIDQIKEKVDNALLFDAYYEQSLDLSKHHKGNDINGIEKVLYQCPHCHEEGTITVENDSTLVCKKCGFKATANKYGLLESDDPDFKYKNPAMWDNDIYQELKKYILKNKKFSVSSKADLCIIDTRRHRFIQVGSGELYLDKEIYKYTGTCYSNNIEISNSSKHFYILPNSPVKNSLEFQDGDNIYRFILKDEGQYVTKWIHLLKIFYLLNTGIDVKVNPKEIR